MGGQDSVNYGNAVKEVLPFLKEWGPEFEGGAGQRKNILFVEEPA